MKQSRFIYCKYCGKGLEALHGRQLYHGHASDKNSCAYKAIRNQSKINGKKYRVKVYKNPSRSKTYIQYLKDKAHREGKSFVMPKPDPFY